MEIMDHILVVDECFQQWVVLCAHGTEKVSFVAAVAAIEERGLVGAAVLGIFFDDFGGGVPLAKLEDGGFLCYFWNFYQLTGLVFLQLVDGVERIQLLGLRSGALGSSPDHRLRYYHNR